MVSVPLRPGKLLRGAAAAAAPSKLLPEFSVTVTADEDEEYLKENPIKGELDLLNLESLINVNDVKKSGGGGSGGGGGLSTSAPMTKAVSAPPSSSIIPGGGQGGVVWPKSGGKSPQPMATGAVRKN